MSRPPNRIPRRLSTAARCPAGGITDESAPFALTMDDGGAIGSVCVGAGTAIHAPKAGAGPAWRDPCALAA